MNTIDQAATPSTVIIMAPKGAGKARYAVLRAMFGCSCVVNDWDGRAPLPQGALALTSALTASQPPATRTLPPDGAGHSGDGGMWLGECVRDGVRYVVPLCERPAPDHVVLFEGDVLHVARTDHFDRLPRRKGEGHD